MCFKAVCPENGHQISRATYSHEEWHPSFTKRQRHYCAEYEQAGNTNPYRQFKQAMNQLTEAMREVRL